MSTFISSLKLHFSKHLEKYVFLSLVLVSVISTVYFYGYSKQLAYGDALSRLNISRKIVDNLTPGIAQVGNVWLPLPQILMLPLIINSFLWHTGLAGTIVSSILFIAGGFFLFKSAKLITDSSFAALFGLAIYMFDINLLYMQTTAMSETSFIAFSIFLTYCLLGWIIKRKGHFLILSGLMVSALTLIRYEALAILPCSILLVGLCSFLIHKKYSKAEGEVILFTTLAIFGFALWTVYLTVIFGDPLYWKNYYVDIAPSAKEAVTVVSRPGFLASMWWYFTSVVWMNGIIPVLFSLVGLVALAFTTIKKKTVNYLPIFLLLSIYLFMVLTLMRNTPIGQPALTIASLKTIKTNHFNEFNIRYGMLMLPVIALSVSYLLKRKILLQILFILVFSIQIVNYFYPHYTSIYQFNISLGNTIQWNDATARWMRKNYDHGLILVSAEKHDPLMFELNLDYKRYIHEGTDKYWHESLKHPEKYATWIITDFSKDEVGKIPLNSDLLNEKYNLVYNGSSRIYKIKTKPDNIIQE